MQTSVSLKIGVKLTRRDPKWGELLRTGASNSLFVFRYHPTSLQLAGFVVVVGVVKATVSFQRLRPSSSLSPAAAKSCSSFAPKRVTSALWSLNHVSVRRRAFSGDTIRTSSSRSGTPTREHVACWLQQRDQTGQGCTEFYRLSWPIYRWW